jgi:hypothetical protein
LLVHGCPERSSSSTDTQPALKRECRSKTAVQLKECSPEVVSVADLPCFMQNLMQTHCLIFPSIEDKTKHEVGKALV